MVTYTTVRDLLSSGPSASVRRSDGAVIPADPRNADWQAYQAWLKAGNAPAQSEAASPNNAAKPA